MDVYRTKHSQPSATQLDGLCHTLADLKVDRCSFPERKKKKKREGEGNKYWCRGIQSPQSFLVCVCSSISLNNVLFRHLPGAHSAA